MAMNILTAELMRIPPKEVNVIQVMREAEIVTMEESVSMILTALQPILTELKDLKLKVEQLSNAGSTKVTDVKIALYLTNNVELLVGFNVEKNELGQRCVTFKGSFDRDTIGEAFNLLHLKLLPIFGFNSIPWETMRNGIIKAYDWQEEVEDESLAIEAAIHQVVSTYNKRFTIPELKKVLPSLQLKTKDIEEILVKSGCTIRKYNTSPTKYFLKP